MSASGTALAPWEEAQQQQQPASSGQMAPWEEAAKSAGSAQSAQPQAPVQPRQPDTVSAAPEPGIFQRARESVANSAIGSALHMQPTLTPGTPEYEQSRTSLPALPDWATKPLMTGPSQQGEEAVSPNPAQEQAANARLRRAVQPAATWLAGHPKTSTALDIGAGVAQGAGGTVQGLTSPANLALLAAAPEAKPLMALFSAQAAKGAYDNAEQAYQAFRQGKNVEAAKFATESGLSAVIAGLAGRSALKGAFPVDTGRPLVTGPMAEGGEFPQRQLPAGAPHVESQYVGEPAAPPQPGGIPDAEVTPWEEARQAQLPATAGRTRDITPPPPVNADTARVRVAPPQFTPRTAPEPGQGVIVDAQGNALPNRPGLPPPRDTAGRKTPIIPKAVPPPVPVQVAPTPQLQTPAVFTGQRPAAPAVPVAVAPAPGAQPPAAQAAAPAGQPGGQRPVVQASTEPTEIQQSAEAQKPVLKSMAEQAVDGVPGAKVEGMRVKEPEAVENKEDRGKPPETIVDHLGARVSAPTPEAVEAVKANVESQLPVRSADKIDSNGLQADQYAVQTGKPGEPNQQSELQVVTADQVKAMKATDDLYDQQKKALAAGDKAKADELGKKIAEQFREAQAPETQNRAVLSESPEQTQLGNPKPLQPGDAITYETNKGKTRPARVVRVDGDRALIKDSFAEIWKPLAKLKAEKQPEAAGGGAPTGSTPAAKGDKWIGVDLDGTLAHDDGFKGKTVIGEPIPAMVDRIKQSLADGNNVKILTARVSDDPTGEAKEAIQDWTEEDLGKRLDVTDVKDSHMTHLYDDRAVTVERNTGKLLAEPQPETGEKPNAIEPRNGGQPSAATASEGGGKEQPSAVQKPSAEGVLQRQPEEDRPGGGGRVQQVEQGNEPARKGAVEEKPLDQQGGGQGKEEVKPAPHRYGSTQADIPPESEAGKALARARKAIIPEDLAGEGMVTDSHITVRYGLSGDADTSKVRAYLEQQAPFEAILGKTQAFPPSEHSDGAAPIIVPVESADLRRMERELDKHGDFVERSFPEYKPHATLAYVKPGEAKRYTGMNEAEGKKFTVNSVSISKKDGTVEEIQLKGNPKPSFYKASDAKPATPPTMREQIADNQARQIGGPKSNEHPKVAPSPEPKLTSAESFKRAIQAKADKYLDTQVRRESGQVLTRREIINERMASGGTTAIKQVQDDAAERKLDREIGAMRKAGVPTGNEMHPKTIKYREMLAQQKAGIKVPSYRIKSADGTEWIVSKTEYDYAKSIEGRQVPENGPQPKTVDTTRVAIMRSEAEPALDIHREPTGWLQYDSANARTLVHPTENTIVRFESKDFKSGTALLRAKAEAQAYAIDHPIERAESKPAGDLIVKPIFGGEGERVIPASPATSAKPVGTMEKAPQKGDIVHAMFGKAVVTSVSRAKPKKLDNGQLFEGGKIAHRQMVKDALAAGKSVPSEVLANYPDLSKTAKPAKIETPLDKFEHEGKSPYEITQKEWIALQRAHREALGQSQDSGTRYAPNSDYEGYHEESVRTAKRMGIDVSPEVLKDYPDIAPKPAAPVKAEGAPQETPKSAQTGPQAAMEAGTTAKTPEEAYTKAVEAYKRTQPADDQNGYNIVLNGLSAFLEKKGIEPAAAYLDRAKETGASPLLWELSSLFHSPLAGAKGAETPAELGKQMDYQVKPSNVPNYSIQTHPRDTHWHFDDKYTGQSMRDYYDGKFGEDISSFENGAETLRRKAEIVKSLIGETENTKSAEAEAARLDKVAATEREYAQTRIKEKEADETKEKAAQERLPITRAEHLQPLDAVRLKPKEAWRPELSRFMKGKTWISDGHIALNLKGSAGAAGQKALDKIMPPADRQEIGAGVDQIYSADKAIDLKPLGALSSTDSGEKTDLAFFLTPKNEPIGVSAHKLRLIQNIYGKDGLTFKGKGGKNSIGVTKDGKLVAILMPWQIGDDMIDVPTAKKTMAAGGYREAVESLTKEVKDAIDEIPRGISPRNDGEGNRQEQDQSNKGPKSLFSKRPQQPDSAGDQRSIGKESGTGDGKRGEIEPEFLHGGIGAVDLSNAIPKPIRDYLEEKGGKIAASRELQTGLYNLESQHDADVLRAVQLMKEMPGTPKDFEAIYHHLENSKETLTKDQRNILNQYIKPLMKADQAIYEKLNPTKQPVENYVHRIAQQKGSQLERILKGSKGTGGGNLLKKSNSASKKRTMMAIEKPNGTRRVVSVSRGLVTPWTDGIPGKPSPLRAGMTNPEEILDERLEPIERELGKLQKERSILSSTKSRLAAAPRRLGNIDRRIAELEKQKGEIEHEHMAENLPNKVWQDRNGTNWTFKQATTKEIEANSPVEYYKNAAASAILNHIELRKAERAYDFIEDFKKNPEFNRVGIKPANPSQIPDGWRPANLPQFMGYYFEPHTADVLDWYAKRIGSEGPSLYLQISNFLTTSIFLNPIAHVPNLTANWIMEKGIELANPAEAARQFKAGVKAIGAVAHQNHDFLDALDAGAALHSQKQAVGQFTDLLMKKLQDDVTQPGVMGKLKDALGDWLNPVTAVKTMVNAMASRITWPVHDFYLLQSAYSKMAGNPDLSLKNALEDTGRYLPNERVPTSILGSKGIASALQNRSLVIFNGYHYSVLKAFGQVLKNLGGMGFEAEGENAKGEPTNKYGRTAEQEKFHALNILVGMALFTYVVMPQVDRLVRTLTRDKTAEFRRAGFSTMIHAVEMVMKGERTPVEALRSAVTPAPLTELGLDLATNRDIFGTQRHIYDIHGKPEDIAKEVGGRAAEAFSPGQYYRRATTGPEGLRNTLLNLAGVSFPMHGALKIAATLQAERFSGSVQTPAQKEKSALRSQALHAAWNGDMSILKQALESNKLDWKQKASLQFESTQPPLAVETKDMTLDDLRKVWEAATPEEKKILQRAHPNLE